MPGSFVTPWSASANILGSLIFYILWGVYLSLFTTTMMLLRSKGARMSATIVVIIALFIDTFITAIIGLLQLYRAFVTYPGGPKSYWDLSATLGIDQAYGIAYSFLFALSTNIAYGLLVWRLYIVWDRNKYVLICPAISFALYIPTSFTSAGMTISITIHGVHHGTLEAFQILNVLSMANAVALCWYNTSMTCGRLWYMRRQLMKYCDRPNPYLRVITVLVESGLLYSLSTLTFLLFYAIPSDIGGYGCTVAMNVCSIMVAIAPTLVVLRLAQGYLHPSDSTDTFSMPEFRRSPPSAQDTLSQAEAGQSRDQCAEREIWSIGAAFGRPRQQKPSRRNKLDDLSFADSMDSGVKGDDPMDAENVDTGNASGSSTDMSSSAKV